jgi:hypothetical protein
MSQPAPQSSGVCRSFGLRRHASLQDMIVEALLFLP